MEKVPVIEGTKSGNSKLKFGIFMPRKAEDIYSYGISFVLVLNDTNF